MAREYIDELGDGTINPETSGVDSQATDNGTHVKTLAPIYYTPATIANDGKATRETPVTIKSALDGKQNTLATQTAYSAKGTATKVPQITTNSLGQVTGITEVTISGVTPASHAHGNIANGGTLTDTAAAAAGNDYVVIRDADNAKIQTSTIKGTDVADAVSKTHSHSTLTLSTTAQSYDGSHTLALPSTDPYTSARTPVSHASTATTYGIGTTSTYGHVKLATGDMNGATNTDGVAVSKNHTHSQYAPKASPALTGTPTAPTAADGTNTTQIATTAFVQSAVTQGLAVSDAMVYKGTITLGATSPGGLTVAADKGHTYKVVANGNTKEGYVDGVKVEAGDMVICNTDSTAAATSSNYSTIAAKWDFVQGNTDGVVIGPTSAVSGNVAVFDGATGKLISDGGTLGTAAFKDVASSGNASSTQVVMGNDTRLTDSRTPTSHTHGKIQNDGTITSDTAVASGDKLVITDSSDSNKVARSGLAFDATTTNQFLSKYGTFRHMLTADAKWGGKFTNALSPGDTYFFMQRNCFFGAKASAISVEYSTDGGTTWIDYGLTNDQKISLFSQYGGSGAYCGKNTHIQPGYTGSISGTKDLTDDIISNQRLRITIARQALSTEGSTSNTDGWMDCKLRRIGVYMSTQSANANGGYSHCVFSGYKRTDFRAGNNNWIVFGDYNVAGDRGWNSIPCNNESTANGGINFGASADSHYVAIRFEFWCDKLSASPAASQTGNMLINRITGFSELIGSNYSINPNMANGGMPCTVSPTTGLSTFSYGIKFTGRKLAVSLSNTSTDTSFDGSADVTNIKTTGTLGIANGGTGATTAKGASYNINAGMNSGDSDAIVDTSRFAFNYSNASATTGGLYYRTAPKVWDWIKGKLTSDTSVNISGNAATASAAQSGSALETAINTKQAALTINDSKPITIGTAAAANTVAGQAHTHDGITSVARASVTNIDISNSGTEPARMTLSQVTSQTTEGTDPGDGYVLNLLWDNAGNRDTQIYVPNSKKADKDFGHLKMRYKNESSTWGEWEYLPGAFKGTLLTGSDDLDTLYQGLPGEVLQYYWNYTNKAYSTVGKTQSGMDATTGLPTGTGTANLFVFHQSTSRTASGYVAQLMVCADIGIYYRRQFNGTWNTWTKILVATDITTDTTNKNGKITVDGTDKTVYVHPAGSAASKTGVPTANATPAFGGTFKVNQITTDATSHVSAVTERTITIPNTTGNASTAGLTKLYTASGTNTDGTMTQNAIKTALDGKANGMRWTAVTKGQTWSRLFYSAPETTVEGSNGILAVSCTRGGVVCNATFLITASHNRASKSSIIELASCDYTQVRSRLVVNSSGNYYFEVYDTANSITSSTTQRWHCTFVPLLGADVTTYTEFTDGTTIPTNYTATNDFTTTGGNAAAAIKNITRSGTTFTATRQDGSTFTFTQQDSNTDTKVKATEKANTDNANYKILATASASPTSGDATEAVYAPNITLNPSTNTISANISGNAAKVTVSEDASNELQVVGVQSSATSTLKRDSSVTVQGGAVKATTFKLGTNATITYNSTTEAIDFTFL